MISLNSTQKAIIQREETSKETLNVMRSLRADILGYKSETAALSIIIKARKL